MRTMGAAVHRTGDGEVILETWIFPTRPANRYLFDVNFIAQPGTVTALVGSSGAGKSTIIGLIAAFYKPEADGSC